MIHLKAQDIASFQKQYRTNLINGLSGYKSAHLLGTQNTQGQLNLAIFSNVIHIGANPPLMGVLHRPVTVEKHSYENIKETGYFTLNHVPVRFFKAAHQTSARYARAISEFDATGFTPWHSPSLAAPYVLESPVKIGLSLLEEKPIESNGTLLLIGQIEELWIEDNLIHPDGYLELGKANTALVQGLETYYEAKFIERLPYAKPDNTPQQEGA